MTGQSENIKRGIFENAEDALWPFLIYMLIIIFSNSRILSLTEQEVSSP